MRLQVSFTLLLLIAATATSLVWANLGRARDGDIAAQAIVFVLAPLALISLALLGRIIVKVKTIRQGARSLK